MIEPASLADIQAEIRRADYIAAYDKTRLRLEAGDNDPELRYLGVLSLARAGATARAAASYRADGLHLVRRGVVSEALWLDCKALWPRILKDTALAAPPPDRPRLLLRAARAYRSLHALTGRFFPGINAATLLYLAGRRDDAAGLSAVILRQPDLEGWAEEYWAAATRAEALVIAGRWDEAADALARARQLAGADYGALSSTRRQLGMLLDAMRPTAPLPDDLMSLVALPTVCHFSGFHVEPDAEEALSRAVASRLSLEGAGFGVGTLWSRGAVVAAEQVLRHGGELHLVLPFGETDFLDHFRRHGTSADATRRERCLGGATTVTSATSDGDFPDPELVGYAETVSAGLAEIRARSLTTLCRKLDVADPGARPVVDPIPVPAAVAAAPEGCWREIRTFLFADVFRFSAIPESQLPDFWAVFMQDLAQALHPFRDRILYRNTWGDALFLVLADIESAAELAIVLQERAAAARRRERSTPEIRIGLHHGPVFRGHDPIRDVPSYFGTQVSRAARVEPIAPPGAVFVTEPFAAILAAGGSRRFEAEYVGRVPLAKKYGEHRMYRLARRWAD